MRSTSSSARVTSWTRWRRYLGQRVEASSLAAFRCGFGTLICWHLLKQLLPTGGTTTVRFLYSDTPFHFKYPGFEWVTAPPEPWMSCFVAGLAICALAVAVGMFYRVASWLLFLGFSYLFLLGIQETFIRNPRDFY